MINWTKYKVIVFESDDWGQCYCTPSTLVHREMAHLLPEQFRDEGKATLEDSEDMQNLFHLLRAFRGGDGRHALFQPNYVVGNPDFAYISETGSYRGVSLPDFPEEWERPGIIEKAKKGIDVGIWYPEFHGSNHYNYRYWMKCIQRKEPAALLALKYHSIALWAFLHQKDHESNHEFYDHISEYGSKVRFKNQQKDFDSGVKAFKRTFDRLPSSFIAPAYCWQRKTEHILSQNGISIIQAKERQFQPRSFAKKVNNKMWKSLDPGRQERLMVHMGDYNKKVQLRYLRRNVDFEPREPALGMDNAFRKIVVAWENNLPAIISTHRINYVNLNKSFVDRNFQELKKLLHKISTVHPEAVYLTDSEVDQLYTRGISVLCFNAHEIICRNYTSKTAEVNVKIPEGSRVVGISRLPENERLDSYVILYENMMELIIPPGHFCIEISAAS